MTVKVVSKMARSGRPNILFLFPDQHRWDWMEPNPDLPVKMPNVEMLAKRGIRFDQAVCNSPLCAPSRASLASVRRYHRCGVANNENNYPLEQPTFYQRLRDAGYRVAGVGKFDIHKMAHYWGIDGQHLLPEMGFTDGIDNEGKRDCVGTCAEEPLGPYSKYLHDNGLMQAHADDFNGRRGEHRDAEFDGSQYVFTHPTPLPDEAYCDNWITERGQEVLRSLPDDQPWFLQVNFAGPHEPMDVTESMLARWQGVDFPQPHRNTQQAEEAHVRVRRNYAAMIENIDARIGDLLKTIEERGELDNTIVVYTSDHGDMLGDHDEWEKTSFYQPSVAVPLIIAGPGIRKGMTSAALVELVDLPATFMDYGETAALPDADGLSLRPLLEGTTDAHRPYVISGMTVTGEPGTYPLKRAIWNLIWDGRYKLVRRHEEPDLLFDLEQDPWESRDVFDDHPGIAARLAEPLTAELARS
jgi:arylsulfatase